MGIEIPKSIIQAFEKSSDPMDNDFFLHAKKALKSLNQMTEELYCYDHVSMAINSLERIYKGFLKAATIHCEWYSLPSENFLNEDHDILGMVLEIKENFPDVFPRVDRQAWRDTKDFLRDLRKEYSRARYDDYPSYSEFYDIRAYVNAQYELIENYIKSRDLIKDGDQELHVDY